MQHKKMDYTLFIVTIMLVAFGLLMVFSSSYYYAIEMGRDKMYFFNSELKWSILGLITMFVASFFDYKYFKPLAIPMFIFSLALLVWVLVKGVTINNAQRWIAIGSQTFQPVEFTKIATIVLVAFLLEKNYLKLNHPRILLQYLVIAVVNALLILEQPNMSSAMIVVGIVAVMIFAAGLNWLYVISLGSLGGFVAFLFIKSADYRYDRWLSFLNPFDAKDDGAYQVIQSLYALGTGGLFGVGLGMSTQNKLYIPEPQNDFILATIGEEFGFIGTVILLILFLILIYRCIKIAINAPDTFSMFLATGITGMFTLQVIMNYAVATSSMPATGVSLPLISYGGTSILVLLGALGVMLNISKHCGDRAAKGDES